MIEMRREEFGALDKGIPGFADGSAAEEGFDRELDENVGEDILR